MATKRTQIQKDISTVTVRRGISAKRYLPETTPVIKENALIRRSKKVDAASPETRQLIEKKAYELYEQRGYTQGNDLQDWLQAEQIIVQELA